MPHLVLCSPTFWPEPVGTPRYATDAARWFRGRQWDVTVVTAQPFYPDFERYPGWGRQRRRDVLDGIPVHRVPTIVPRGGRTLGRVVGDVNFGVQVLASGRLRRLPTADAVLTFSPGVPLGVAAAVGFRRTGPHVAVVHDLLTGLAAATGMARGALLSGIGLMERSALRLADHRIVLSDAMDDSLHDLGVDGATSVVPIWVDVPVAETAPPPRGAGFTIGYSGNLGRKQGVGLLLDVCDELAGDEVTVRLRGRGPLRDVARERSRHLPNVEVLDLVPPEQLVASLGEVDLHLVPQGPGTESSSMPSKVLNIFASGRPMLAVCESDGPLHDLAERGLSLWSPPDPRKVAAVVREVRRDPGEALRCAARALAHVREHHDRDRLLGRIEELLVA